MDIQTTENKQAWTAPLNHDFKNVADTTILLEAGKEAGKFKPGLGMKTINGKSIRCESLPSAISSFILKLKPYWSIGDIMTVRKGVFTVYLGKHVESLNITDQDVFLTTPLSIKGTTPVANTSTPSPTEPAPTEPAPTVPVENKVEKEVVEDTPSPTEPATMKRVKEKDVITPVTEPAPAKNVVHTKPLNEDEESDVGTLNINVNNNNVNNNNNSRTIPEEFDSITGGNKVESVSENKTYVKYSIEQGQVVKRTYTIQESANPVILEQGVLIEEK